MPDAPGASKVIWDMAVIAWLIHADWTPSILTHSPLLNDHQTYSLDQRRHLVRVVAECHRDPVFADFFSKLQP